MDIQGRCPKIGETLPLFISKKEKKMRYYWEVLFSAEYFPYWEFTMLMMLALQLSHLWRVHRIERKIDETIKELAEEHYS
jgi:hypothetical protein